MRVKEVLRYVPSIRPEVPAYESQNHGVKLPPYFNEIQFVAFQLTIREKNIFWNPETKLDKIDMF